MDKTKNEQKESKENKIVGIIRDYQEKNGFSPSVREIRDASGIKSTSTVHAYLHRLQEMGRITIERNVCRAITLTEKENEWIPASKGLPEENKEVLVTVKENDGYCYTTTSWFQEGRWVIKKSALNPAVVAWQRLPKPYKGE